MCPSCARGIYILKFMETNDKLCKQIAEVWKEKQKEERTRHLKIARDYSASSGVSVKQIKVELLVPLMDILGHKEEPKE